MSMFTRRPPLAAVLIGLGWWLAVFPLAAEEIPLPDPPWTAGQTLDSGWVIEKVVRRPEFVRLSLWRGKDAALVEIALRGENSPPEFSTQYYRVQPTPGAPARAKTMRRLAEQLRAMEQAPGYRPFLEATRSERHAPVEVVMPDGSVRVDPVGPQTARSYEAPSFPLDEVLAGAAFGLFGISLLTILVWKRRLHPERGRGLFAFIVGTFAVMTAAALLIDVEAIDPLRFTVVHEGLTRQNLSHLYGVGVHAGPAFDLVTRLFAFSGVDSFRYIMRLNVLLTILNGLILGFVAWRVSRSAVFALVMVLMYATGHDVQVAAFSELPSPLITTIFLLTLPAADVLFYGPPRSRAALAATFHLFSAGLLAMLLRWEMLVIGLCGFLTALVHLVGAGRIWTLLRDWLRAGLRRFLALPGWIVWPALALAAGTGLIEFDSKANWFYSAVNLLMPTVLTFPFAGLIYQSLLFVVLVILGAVVLLRHPVRALWLIVGFSVVYKLFFEASHGMNTELFRYMTYLMGPMYLMACLGWSELELWRERLGRPKHWSKLLAFGAMLLCYHSFMHVALFKDAFDDDYGKYLQIDTLDYDVQQEVRFAIRASREFPQCAIVAYVSEMGVAEEEDEFGWFVFGERLDAPKYIPQAKASLTDVANIELKALPCVLFMESFGCHLRRGAGCGVFLKGLEWVKAGKPVEDFYNCPDERGHLNLPLRFALYRVR